MLLTWHVSSHNRGYWVASSRKKGSPRPSANPLSWPLTRRSLFALGAGAVAAMAAGRPGHARAAPTLTIAPPTLEHAEPCKATVAVQVTIGDLAPGVPYAMFGELWEADEPDGQADFCGEFEPRVISAGATSQQLVLTRGVLVANIGLVKGFGPASDETSSPDLVELFARVWLRHLERGTEYGPWESPRRVAVAISAAEWARPPSYPGSELSAPRGNQPVPTCDCFSVSAPLRTCAA